MSTEQSPTASRVRSLTRSISATRVFLRKQLWIWPVIAAAVLGVIGWTIRVIVEDAVKQSMSDNLKTILDADVVALRIWLKTQESAAEAIAADDLVRKHIESLVQLAASKGSTATTLIQSQPLNELKKQIRPWLAGHGYDGFVVIDRQHRVVAALREELIGRDNLPVQDGLLEQLIEGKATVSRPFRSAILLETESGQARAEVPTMFAAAPVRGSNDEIIAAIGLRIRPEVDFTRILSVARAGDSGETYAFDADGVLISQSRFDAELQQIGLLVDRDEAHSILKIEIRDPQVNMTLGERPASRRSDQPLTRMAASAISGESDVDVEGYRDYRGVPVIGAWTWLPEYGFGVTTEVDVEEAYRPLYILRYAFWGLFFLLSSSAVAIFIFTVIVSRLNRSARKAALMARQLGQYELEEKRFIKDL
jgi:hypothetical protein